MTYVEELRSSLPPPLVGGKAAALSALIGADFKVPRAFAVTVDAYKDFVAKPGINSMLQSLKDADVAVVDQQTVIKRIDDAFLAVDVDDSLRDEVEIMSLCLFDEFNAVVARSSATAEDTHSASFAGQYRSYLDLKTSADVMNAVRLVWASLWYPSARLYRHLHDIGDDELQMAVLVMGQVEATQSGVAFTVDPEQVDAVRVETVSGLAEGLVSGKVTPTVELLSRSARVSANSDQTVDVAKLALHAESLFGLPQDIEWAVDNEGLSIVQSRPITVPVNRLTLDDLVGRTADRWTTSGIAEMLPGPLPPLLWGVNAFFVEQGFRQLFDGMRIRTPFTTNFVGCQNGWPLLNLDLLKDAAESGAQGAGNDIERQYLGSAETSSQTGRRSPATLFKELRAASVRRHAALESRICEQAIVEITELNQSLKVLSDQQLVAYWLRLDDLGARVVAAEIAVAAAAASAYQRLESFLTPFVGAAEASRFAQDATHLDLVAPRLCASSSVFGGARWDESVQSFTPYVVVADDDQRENLEERLTHLPRWRRTRFLTGQIVDVRLHLFHRLTEEAHDLVERRERAKAAVLLLGGEARRVQMEMGSRLVERNIINKAADIQWMHPHELLESFSGLRVSKVVLDAREAAFKNARLNHPPRVIGSGSVVIETNDSLMHGWAASGGRYSGRARVLDSPDAEVNEGDVVVAYSTDASWLPVFLKAGALIVEEGGPLSHAAVVARELGRPAVLNIPGVVNSLQGRDVDVVVDGSKGTIEVLDKSAAAAVGASTSPLVEVDNGGLAVFVPAVMGAGAMFSILVWARDALHRVTAGRIGAQRVELCGHLSALATLHGDASLGASTPKVDRRSTAITAVAMFAVSVYVFVGATANYLRRDGYVSDIAWLWALSAAVSAGLGFIALGAFFTAIRGGKAPVWAWSTLAGLPGATRMERDRLANLAALLSACVLVTILSVIRRGRFEQIERSVFNRVHNWHALDSVEWMSGFGRTEFVIPLALICLVIFWSRDRRLAIAYPASVAAGVVINVVLKITTHVPRPEPSLAVNTALASYPSGHVMQATILAGFAPAIALALTGSRSAARVAGTAFVTVAFVVALVRVHLGVHWPADVIGGALIGASIVVAANKRTEGTR